MDRPPLVAEHDSWIDVEPVVGCPASCAYCFLGPLGLGATGPQVRVVPHDTMEQLTTYLDLTTPTGSTTPTASQPPNPRTPVAIGNYTDLFMSRTGREYILDFLPQFAATHPDRPLCLITKGHVDSDFLRLADKLDHPILIFLSQSFARYAVAGRERGPTVGFDATLRNATRITATRNIIPIHFWRPFLSRWNPREELAERVRRLRDAGILCSVVVGLKVGSDASPGTGVAQDISPEEELTLSEDELISTTLWKELAETATDQGYPVYRNTSCSVALAGHRREELGTYVGAPRGDRCLSASCPPSQRELCSLQVHVPEPPRDQVEALLRALHVRGSWSWRTPPDGRAVLTVHSEISEYAYNILSHRLEVKVHAPRVAQEKAWLGAFTGRAHDG